MAPPTGHVAALQAQEETALANLKHKIENALINQFSDSFGEISLKKENGGYTLSMSADIHSLQKAKNLFKKLDDLKEYDVTSPLTFVERYAAYVSLPIEKKKQGEMKLVDAGAYRVEYRADTLTDMVYALNRAVLNGPNAIDPAPYAGTARA